jgi:hypothetical protein
MCDAIEGVVPGEKNLPDENGVGVSVALNNYAAWFKDTYLPGCK